MNNRYILAGLVLALTFSVLNPSCRQFFSPNPKPVVQKASCPEFSIPNKLTKKEIKQILMRDSVQREAYRLFSFNFDITPKGNRNEAERRVAAMALKMGKKHGYKGGKVFCRLVATGGPGRSIAPQPKIHLSAEVLRDLHAKRKDKKRRIDKIFFCFTGAPDGDTAAFALYPDGTLAAIGG